MIPKDALYLISAINTNVNEGFVATSKDLSVINNIIIRIRNGKLISEKQSWALQEIYRRSTGHCKKLYSRII